MEGFYEIGKLTLFHKMELLLELPYFSPSSGLREVMGEIREQYLLPLPEGCHVLPIPDGLFTRFCLEVIATLEGLTNSFVEHPNFVVAKFIQPEGLSEEVYNESIYTLEHRKWDLEMIRWEIRRASHEMKMYTSLGDPRERLFHLVDNFTDRMITKMLYISFEVKKRMLGVVKNECKVLNDFIGISFSISGIPSHVQTWLGIDKSPKFCRGLIHLMNNTAFYVPPSQPSQWDEWNELEWVQIRKIEPQHNKSLSSTFSIRNTPEVLIMYGYVDLFSLWRSMCFGWSDMLELFFFFDSEKWMSFIVDVLRSAAKKGVRRSD